MTRQQTIHDKLSVALHPSRLDVENESRNHSVPAGSETHFKVLIVSEAFEGLGLVERHRRVHAVLADDLKKGLHALTIRALTAAQWSEQGAPDFQSPECLGGSKS